MLQKVIESLKDPKVVVALGVGLVAPSILFPLARSLKKFIKVNK